MKLDFWINTEKHDEIFTAGTFGWVWQEGDTLRAGPGPRFGNDDAEGRVVARFRDGLWWPTDYVGNTQGFTDFDVQLVRA
jgi:hypothetical protein